jgi:hypothetical protein
MKRWFLRRIVTVLSLAALFTGCASAQSDAPVDTNTVELHLPQMARPAEKPVPTISEEAIASIRGLARAYLVYEVETHITDYEQARKRKQVMEGALMVLDNGDFETFTKVIEALLLEQLHEAPNTSLMPLLTTGYVLQGNMELAKQHFSEAELAYLIDIGQISCIPPLYPPEPEPSNRPRLKSSTIDLSDYQATTIKKASNRMCSILYESYFGEKGIKSTGPFYPAMLITLDKVLNPSPDTHD